VAPVQKRIICRVPSLIIDAAWRWAAALAWPRAAFNTEFAPLSHMLMNGFFASHGFFIGTFRGRL